MATVSEKEMFMAQLDSYAAGQIPQHSLVESVKELLSKYPNRYLEESTLINGGSKVRLWHQELIAKLLVSNY